MDTQKLTELLQQSPGQLLDRTLFEISGTPISIATLVVFVVILVATMIASAILQRIVSRAMKFRGIDQPGSIGVTRRLLHYVTMVIGTCIGLQTIGIDLSALFAAGAIFAIGLGFAMRNMAENFVSGVILLAERTIKPGDVLEIDDEIVRVVRMGIRATIVRSRDDEEVIVPNMFLVQSNVTNYTLRDSFYRLRTVVGVTYDSDMKQVREVLTKAATDLDWRIQDRNPVILMTQFGSSSVDWDVSVWVDDPWLTMRGRSDLNEAIWWALQGAGITIAFPQLDVHLDTPVDIRQIA